MTSNLTVQVIMIVQSRRTHSHSPLLNETYLKDHADLIREVFHVLDTVNRERVL